MQKNKKEGFQVLLDNSGASLLGNLLTDKGTIRAGEGGIAKSPRRGTITAGEGF